MAQTKRVAEEIFTAEPKVDELPDLGSVRSRWATAFNGTRRAFERLLIRAWITATLVPWPAAADDCTGTECPDCPNQFQDCSPGNFCGAGSGGGVFTLGCPTGVPGCFQSDVCAWCPPDGEDPACPYITCSFPAVCCGVPLWNSFSLCCQFNICSEEPGG